MGKMEKKVVTAAEHGAQFKWFERQHASKVEEEPADHATHVSLEHR